MVYPEKFLQTIRNSFHIIDKYYKIQESNYCAAERIRKMRFGTVAKKRFVNAWTYYVNPGRILW